MYWDDDKLAHGQGFGSSGTENFRDRGIHKDSVVLCQHCVVNTAREGGRDGLSPQLIECFGQIKLQGLRSFANRSFYLFQFSKRIHIQ